MLLLSSISAYKLAIGRRSLLSSRVKRVLFSRCKGTPLVRRSPCTRIKVYLSSLGERRNSNMHGTRCWNYVVMCSFFSQCKSTPLVRRFPCTRIKVYLQEKETRMHGTRCWNYVVTCVHVWKPFLSWHVGCHDHVILMCCSHQCCSRRSHAAHWLGLRTCSFAFCWVPVLPYRLVSKGPPPNRFARYSPLRFLELDELELPEHDITWEIISSSQAQSQWT